MILWKTSIVSALSSSKDSDNNQRESPEEEEGPFSDEELGKWLSNEQKELIIRRRRILPHLPWVFGVLSFTCFMIVIIGYSWDRYYLENVTELAKTFSWLTFFSILVYVFGDSIINSVMGKINN